MASAERQDPAWAEASARGREHALRHARERPVIAAIRRMRSAPAHVRIAVGVLVLAVAASIASFVNGRIWTHHGFKTTCRDTTRAYFLSHGQDPREWHPKMMSILGGEVWYLYGDWYVGTQRYEVLCSATFGRSAENIGYEIGEPN